MESQYHRSSAERIAAGPYNATLARLREIEPGLRLSNLHEFVPLRRREDLDGLAEGERMAELTE